jgi:hypothetical protein
MEITVHVFMHSPSSDDAFRAQLETISHQLTHVERHVMSAISDFATAQKAHNDRVDAALTGLSGDIDTLNATIATLQGTQGAITAEDQTLLDTLQAQGEALAARIEAADALTPPAVPPVTPTV